MKRLLVTGADGFVGSALCQTLADTGYPVYAATRTLGRPLPVADRVVVGDIHGQTDWSGALQGIDTVIHLAARVHVLKDTANEPLAAFRQVNAEGTLNLARQAAAAGVRRFIFISSIKVNGEVSPPGRPFQADDQPQPADAYGQSKHEAELALRQLTADTGLDVVIIRPPLVYGPGVKANFQRVMHWLAQGWPLPLGAINNRRSLVALANLIDLIITCINHPAAANQTFLVSDGDDMTTTDLLKRTAKALGKRAWLMPLPVGWLVMAAKVLGKQAQAQRLLGSLQVDTAKTRGLLGWMPPVAVDRALQETARHYQGR